MNGGESAGEKGQPAGDTAVSETVLPMTLAYQSSAYTGHGRTFWIVFHFAATVYLLLLIWLMGNGGWGAVIAGAVAVPWIAGCALSYTRKPAQFVVAGIAIACILVPSGLILGYYIYHWVTTEMGAMEDTFSLLAFLFFVILQVILCLPAAILALMLKVQRPWKHHAVLVD